MPDKKEIKRKLYYLIPFIFLIVIILLILGIDMVRAGDDYDPTGWSSDIQLTNTTDSVSHYKNMLDCQKLPEGRFNYLYEITESPDETGQYYTCSGSDKLGGSKIQSSNYNFPSWVDNGQWDLTQRQWSYHYDESNKTVKFVIRENAQRIGFINRRADGSVALHQTLSLKEMNIEVDPRYTNIYNRIDAFWDEFGRTHIIITTGSWKENASTWIQTIRFIYLLVTWQPFSVQMQTIWQSPYLDTEPWTSSTDLWCTFPWPYISSDSHSRVIVVHPILLDSTFYRALRIRDLSGNWSTHILTQSTDQGLGLFLPFGGLYVDSESKIHITWYDRSQSSLVYVRADQDGSITIGPWPIVFLYNDRQTSAIRVEIKRTIDGDTILAYNTYAGFSNNVLGNSLRVNPEIYIIVIRDADIANRGYKQFKLVKSPTATECHLSVDDDNNIYLFWFDQRTGCTQLYMKILAHPGISLEIDPNDWANSHFIYPNETKVLPLHLRNVGSVELDSAIYVESNASFDWDLRLSDYRAHLKTFGTVPINLTIFCPPSAKFGESIEIWVNATTSDRDYSSQVRLLMFVQWRRQLDVTCNPAFHLVDPGKKAAYRVTLQNNGDLNETVQVKVRGIGPPGWTVGPGNETFAMRVNDIRFIDITVIAPEDAFADEAHVVLLDFLWGDGVEAAPRLVLRTVVRPTFFVTMDVNRTRAVLRPGETAAFCVTVGNAGNLPGKAYVEVSTLTDPGDWLVILSKETVVLGPGMSEDLELLLGAPANATGGAIMVVRLRAYCPNPFSEVTTDVSAEVVHLLSFATDVPELRWELAPLSSGGRDVNITSGSNLFEIVGFRLAGLEPGWSWWLSAGGVETQTVTVGPGGTVDVEVWLRVPADAPAGRHLLRLYLETEGATVGHIDLVVEVEQIRELSITASPVKGVAYPGSHVEMSVVVRNLGNGPEVVAMCATAPDVIDPQFMMDGANATLVWLPQGESRTLVLWARIADDALTGKGELLVSANSAEDARVTVRASAPFEVVRPLLQVSRVELDPQRPKSGDIVTVRVMLLNSGPVEVVNVTVTMAGAEPEVVASIPPSGEATTTFVWIASGHRNVELQGKVGFGPGNHTIPWSRTVEMSKNPISSSWKLAITMAVVVSLALVACIVVLRWKGTKSSINSTTSPERR